MSPLFWILLGATVATLTLKTIDVMTGYDKDDFEPTAPPDETDDEEQE